MKSLNKLCKSRASSLSLSLFLLLYNNNSKLIQWRLGGAWKQIVIANRCWWLHWIFTFYNHSNKTDTNFSCWKLEIVIRIKRRLCDRYNSHMFTLVFIDSEWDSFKGTQAQSISFLRFRQAPSAMDMSNNVWPTNSTSKKSSLYSKESKFIVGRKKRDEHLRRTYTEEEEEEEESPDGGRLFFDWRLSITKKATIIKAAEHSAPFQVVSTHTPARACTVRFISFLVESHRLGMIHRVSPKPCLFSARG